MIINRPNGFLITLSYDKINLYCVSNCTWNCTVMCEEEHLAVHLTEKDSAFSFDSSD